MTVWALEDDGNGQKNAVPKVYDVKSYRCSALATPDLFVANNCKSKPVIRHRSGCSMTQGGFTVTETYRECLWPSLACGLWCAELF